jgi:toxin ParE1/3/4
VSEQRGCCVTEVRLSRRAEADLNDILEYSAQTFGLKQASRYRDGLRDTFSLLASSPSMGRPVQDLGEGIRRHEHGSHVIIYKRLGGYIVILALIHGRRRLTSKSIV